MKNKKRTPLAIVQEKLWTECRRIIRGKYKHTCYTCGAKDLKGANLHTGHMIAKKFVKNYLKYDLRILRPQCYYCNLKLGGLGALFIEHMRQEEGDKYIDGILGDLDKKIKPKEQLKFYEELLEQYKKIC